MNIISKTLHHIGKNKKNVFVIQLGAMDGISFDDTRGFLDMYKWDALLVEPIPEFYGELKENFKDRTNYIYEQAAISDHDGTTEMLTVPNEIILKEDLHPGYKGMSGLFPLKNGFGTTYERDIMVREKFAKTITVPSLTFNSLCEKHNIPKTFIEFRAFHKKISKFKGIVFRGNYIDNSSDMNPLFNIYQLNEMLCNGIT